MSKFKKISLSSIAILFISGCSGPGAETEFAPGTILNPSPVTSPVTSSTNHVKYGETVTTTNGWNISADTTDPVEKKTLPNGWTIEVKYE